MIVRWSLDAKRDREAIWDYLAPKNFNAAVRLDERFSAAVARLADFPELGAVGKIPGTREIFPHETYRFVYEINNDAVWILALVHTSRLWPPV